MESKVEKLPKATIKLSVKVPADKVQETFKHVLGEYAEKTEVAGFRKGKAPLDLIEKSVKQADLNGEVVNHLLQQYYVAALKEHKLTPIGNPKVSLKKFDKDAEFEFEASFAVRPDIKLGDYKSEIKKKAEAKKSEDPLTVEDVISGIRDASEMEISDLLIEEEVTRMLSRLLSQAETLGLSIDQYLSAQNKTAESLKKEYESLAFSNLKAEFAISKSIELENVKVEESEIEAAINAIPDEKVRANLQKGTDRWYIISVLTKNKLISKLIEELQVKKSATTPKKEESK